MTDKTELQRAVAAGRAVVIAGAGVSIATTSGAGCANWLGLIRDGVQYVVDRDDDPERWQRIVNGQLALAVEGDTDQLLQAAGQVASRLRRMGEQAFANWLDSSVGSLEVVDDSWGRALFGLGAPIFTTNYDTLLEQMGGATSRDWMEARGFQDLIANGGSIGHLHGVYTAPHSVVLSEVDYERQMSSDGVQALQKALSATKSLVYIGCGGTLEDPNFTNLLEWHRSVFPVSGVVHYRLCTADEHAALVKQHRNDNIRPVIYGAKHEDLPQFLASISAGDDVTRSSSGVIRDSVAEAREYLLEEIRRQTLLTGGDTEMDERSLEELVIPPVLLPVPHAEFLKAQTETAAKPKRLNPHDELKNDGVMVVVADENAGLSTALRWLLHEAGATRPGAAPLLIDFRTFPHAHDPLTRKLRQEAYYRGLTVKKNATLPELVVGIDDMHSQSRTAERLAMELASAPGLILVGCHSTSEAGVVELLAAAGVRTRVRYLGRLGQKDVQAMARLATPARATKLAEAIITTLRAEHLPRTPFTVGLLLSILMRGETLRANASPTAVLEQYLEHLLGRDDADEDSRFTLTSTDRASIVSDLASLFVELDSGSVLQSAALERLEQFFARFAWRESPADLLAYLIEKRILTLEGSQVRFTQSSFLHLFAAKAVVKYPPLLDRMLLKPIYYSPIIRAYAALIRDDVGLLKQLAPLVQKRWELVGPSSAFSLVEQLPAPTDLDELPDHVADQLPPDMATGGDASSDYDAPEDRDVLPFPLTREDELTAVARFMQALTLVSSVLRDSEEIDDLDLKQAVLQDLLLGWGHALDAVIEDEGYQEMSRQLKLQASEIFGESADEFVDRIVEWFPAMVVYGGIQSTLASRKLLLILEKVLEDKSLREDPTAAVPAVMVLYVLREPEWERTVSELLAPHRQTSVVQGFTTILLVAAYASAPKRSAGETRLKELLADIYLASKTFANLQHRNLIRASYLQRLQRVKSIGALDPANESEVPDL